MVFSCDVFTPVLIQGKLYVRQFYRSWLLRSRKVLYAEITDPDTTTQLSTKRRHPAQLPIAPSDRAPACIPFLLFFLAAITRIHHLAHPSSVVFDEVHFLRFVKEYYNGKYFFDIHPPLGKLILLVVTRLFCGAPTLAYEYNGEEFGDQDYIPLRLTSALFGSTISPVTYLICRELGLSLPASLLPALIQVVEHLSLIESRLILLDAQLMAFMSLALLLALRMWGAPHGQRWPVLIGTALASSAAISIKWTALVTPALVAIVSIIPCPFTTSPLLVSEMIIAGAVAVTFYIGMFWIHFHLLPRSGSGDAFMTRNFQKTLIGGKWYEEGYQGPGFIRNFAYLNYEMFIANRGIKTRHQWESRWWQWVFNQKGLLYLNDYKSDLKAIEKIYLIVNPAVTVITLAYLTVFVGILIAYTWKTTFRGNKWVLSRRMRAFLSRGGFLLAGFLLNLLPYLKISRCTFLYHYLPALFYALLGSANLLDVVPLARTKVGVCIVSCVVVFISFVFWSPWIYAFPLHSTEHAWRHLNMKNWN